MDTNFWGFILEASTFIFKAAFAAYPARPPNEVFSALPKMISDAMVPALYWISPWLDLRLVGVILALVLFLEGVRVAVAIWRWILSVIPAAS